MHILFDIINGLCVAAIGLPALCCAINLCSLRVVWIKHNWCPVCLVGKLVEKKNA